MDDYSTIAQSTFVLFKHLIFEYFDHEDYLGTYKALKDFSKRVKACFNLESSSASVSFLYNFMDVEHTVVSLFWAPTYDRFSTFISDLMDDGNDYTKSIAWLMRCDILSQTRYMGYLPYWMSVENRQKYLEKISREPEIPSEDDVRIIFNATIDEMKEGDLTPN